MTNSREQILGQIGQALGRGAPKDGGPKAVARRLAKHAANLVPKRAKLTAAKRRDLFIAMAEEAAATVRRVDDWDGVPGAVAQFLRGENLPAEVVVAADAGLDSVRWEKHPMLKVRRGRAEPRDENSVTGAFAAVAETGTLMLLSGPHSPTTLNFLPENHIAIVAADQIVGSYEDGWDRLRKQHKKPEKGFMPRVVNFVTGPSRSADIEQTIQIGAHGPRRLHIVIVDGKKG